MKHSVEPRTTPAKLSDSVQQRLNMYALAASAAGVGIFALPLPAQAKIVYTPAHVTLGSHQSYELDLNHDGITDFVFYGGGVSSHYCIGRRLLVCASQYASIYPALAPNAIVGKSGGAAALWPGAQIGPKRFWAGRLIEHAKRFCTSGATNCTTKFYGPWANGGEGFKDHYLGFKFVVNGKLHYGWARLNTSAGWTFGVTLTGYAYETIPGKAIKAGQKVESGEEDFGPGASLANPVLDATQPASLGMLALGAQGVPLWRREEAALEGD
jgi:hypothetical protein